MCNPQVPPQGLPAFFLSLSQACAPLFADGWSMYWTRLVWRRESDLAHDPLARLLVKAGGDDSADAPMTPDDVVPNDDTVITDDVDPVNQDVDAAMIPRARVTIPLSAAPWGERHLDDFLGDFDHPVFLLRNPKWVAIGVETIQTRGRGICPIFSLGVRVVGGLLDALVCSRTGSLVMRVHLV